MIPDAPQWVNLTAAGLVAAVGLAVLAVVCQWVREWLKKRGGS